MPTHPLHVLVVEDDPDFARVLTVGLEAVQIQTEVARNGAEGLARLKETRQRAFDVVLLDITMPVKDGWGLLDELRVAGNETPVIIVSGRNSPEERVRGLKLGADDYVAKPFHFEELVARIEAVLRRRRSLEPLRIGELELDLARRRVTRQGKGIDVSPREFDLLYAVVLARGSVLSRKELLEQVWDMNFDPGTNILDVHLGRLRRKLDRVGRPAIQTVRGEGYRINVENLESARA